MEQLPQKPDEEPEPSDAERTATAGGHPTYTVSRHQRSLFGAARPFTRKTPPPVEQWDDLIAEAAVEDYFKGNVGE